MPQLVLPSDQYKASFLQAIREYQAEQLPHYVTLQVEELERDFDHFLRQLEQETRGEGLPEGRVPHTEYWLVDNGEFIGRVDIRHTLNEQLEKTGGNIGYDVRPTKRRRGYGKLALQLGLEKAKEMGLGEVLVTCDVDNVGSTKIIEASGGVFQNVEPAGTGKPDKARYKIRLSS